MGLQVGLNSPRALRAFAILVPVAFGVWSTILGADENWDLYNYHLYNPFAFLNGKAGTDFAPGGLQSFFNPLLDIPYFIAITHLPGPLVGFLMGALHGLDFALLLAIGRAVLRDLPERDARRIPILLALAGCLTANFLSELGNTMGDNTTSVLCLAGLALVVSRWSEFADGGKRAASILLGAGALAGLAVGLKLTNAVNALALCAAFAVYPASLASRLRIAAIFGVGCTLGAAITGGYWHYEMWRTYGNPLFPQFGSLFPNPLAASLSMADTRWVPKGWGERLAWPFLISADAKRVGELNVRQVIWGVTYAAFIAFAALSLVKLRQPEAPVPMEARRRYVVAVVGIGFVLWMFAFSVYRYLVALEFLAPLVVFVLCVHAFGPPRGRRIAAGLLTLAVAVVLLGGMKTWGHAEWGDAPFSVDAPRLDRPGATTVLIAGGNTAWAWLALGLPVEVAITQVGGNFPAGPAFQPHLHSLVVKRGGPAFAVVTAHRLPPADRGQELREFLQAVGLTRGEGGCAFLRWIEEATRPRYTVVASSVGPPGSCAVVPKPEVGRDIEAENRFERESAAGILDRYGFVLDTDSCEVRTAQLAGKARAFQWCSAGLKRDARSPAG